MTQEDKDVLKHHLDMVDFLISYYGEYSLQDLQKILLESINDVD